MVVEDTQIRRICVLIYSLVLPMRLGSGWPVGVLFREPVGRALRAGISWVVEQSSLCLAAGEVNDGVQRDG